MKIVVANSVGVDRDGYHMVHVPSRWSLGVKNFTNCSYYPWQLAYTSALLKRDTSHKVKMLDGVLHGWDFSAYFDRIAAERPDWLIMESSSRTIAEDLRLADAVKKAFGTRLIFTGQHPMAQPEEVLKIADYVCIGEYEYTVLDLVQGRDPKLTPGVYPNARRELVDVDSLPFPEDEDVRRMDYHEPNCRYRQIQMYASRGCPRRCNFCAAATLYYDELNWRPRSVASVIEEIRLLKNKYPEMEGVFFDEETHNIKRSFNIALAKAIQEAGLSDLKYEAMCEYASLDESALEEMRKAGYYKIRVGVETASDIVAEQMTLGKKHDITKLRKLLAFGKKLGMMFYGTFTVGGLGSSEKEDQKTVDLIHELSSKGMLDEVQVSINTPQPGTDFYNTAVKNSYLLPISEWAGFDGNGHVMVEYPHYKAGQIQAMFQKALTAFDHGKSSFMTAPFSKAIAESLERIPQNASVLLLRSARQWMILPILETLHQRRNIKADLLGQDIVLKELQINPHLKQAYSYGDGFFLAESVPSQMMALLKSNRYDYVLIPMANNNLQGYQNVLEVAECVQPKNILGVYPDGSVKPLSQHATTIKA